MVSVQNSTKAGAGSNRLPNNVSSFVVILLAKVRFGLQMSIPQRKAPPKPDFAMAGPCKNSVDSSRYVSRTHARRPLIIDFWKVRLTNSRSIDAGTMLRSRFCPKPKSRRITKTSVPRADDYMARSRRQGRTPLRPASPPWLHSLPPRRDGA